MSAETLRVLVVESDAGRRATFEAALADNGANFKVVAAGHLNDALDRLRAEPYDVVLADLDLPEAHGLGTFAALYATASDTPIVVLAEPDDEATALKAVKAGAQDYLLAGQVHSTLLTRALRYAVERRRSEEQIRLQARLLEAVGQAVIATDRDGIVRYWNRFAERLYGWTVAQAVGRPLAELVVPERSVAFSAHVMAGALAGVEWSGEMELRHRNGTVFPGIVTTSPIHDSNGELIGVVGVSGDISDRKRAEAEHERMQEQLRRSEERFRSLVENGSDMIAVIGGDLRIRYVSPSVRAILGYSTADLVGRYAYELVEAADRAKAVAVAQRVRKNPRVMPTVELRARHRDGTYRTIEVKARNMLHDPAMAGLVVNARDVTERTLAREALRESNETLRALITASPLAIVALDAGGRVTMWNPSAERMFGWRESEVVGSTLPIVAEEDSDQFRTRLAATLEGHSYTGVEIVCRRRDGGHIDVSVSAAPLRDGQRRVRGTMAMLEDLTPRKELEERLLHSQKMEAIGRLAGGVAHDFNNLLTAITGHSQLLLESLPHDEEARADVLEIDHAATRAAALTKQLLAFSRKQVLQPTVLDVNALVAGIERLLRRVIGEDIELVTVLHPATGRIKADPGQVEQVIMNLVVNARDAMPAGGHIVIETANTAVTAETPAPPAGVPPGDYVQLTITDSGVGMDRETLSHVFEPFFTTKEPGKGTGLGLSTVYGIVNQSGGHVWAHSEPGHGTVFKVFLPRIRRPEKGRTGTAAEAPQPHGSETILLVEDESAVRALTSRVLRKYGYTVIEAPSGDEAIQLARRHTGPIDLLVTDVVMPGMSGREVADRIRASRPDTRILFTSGYTPEAILQHRVLTEGAPFLAKPFTPASLAAKVRHVLNAEESTAHGP